MATGLALGAAPAVSADEVQVLDRLQIGVGTFFNRLNLDGRFDGSVEFDGSTRDFDHELGFDKQREIEFWQVGWRPFDDHQIDLIRYRDERVRRVNLDEPLRFRGEEFPIQAALRGSARFIATELDYTWWAWHNETAAVGPQLGVLRLQAGVSLRGRVASDEFGTVEGAASVDEQVYAPLIGITGRWQASSNWRFQGDLRLIRLHINAVEGNALSAKIGVSFYPTEHLGLALQYADTRLRAERSREAITGRLEVGFSGPQLLLLLRF